MKRFLLLLPWAILIGVAVGYASASANSIQDIIVYQPLGSGDLADCAGRVDDDLVDYMDITESDGFRWQYLVEPEAGEISADLVVEFICKAQSNPLRLGVLAVTEAKWSCAPIAAGATVENDLIRFDGRGGVQCHGETLEQTIQGAVSHLSINLPAQIEVSYLFASATVAPSHDKERCGQEQVLFADEDVRYALPVDTLGEMRMSFTNRPNSPQSYTTLSAPVDIHSLANISTFVDGTLGARTFVHMIDGLLNTTAPVPYKWLFTMSPHVDSFTLGVGADGFFCGDVGRLIVDPYVGIGSD